MGTKDDILSSLKMRARGLREDGPGPEVTGLGPVSMASDTYSSCLMALGHRQSLHTPGPFLLRLHRVQCSLCLPGADLWCLHWTLFYFLHGSLSQGQDSQAASGLHSPNSPSWGLWESNRLSVSCIRRSQQQLAHFCSQPVFLVL